MTGYKIKDQEGIHFLTITVVSWVDVFTRQLYRDVIIDSFMYCREQKGLNLHAYVIMSNHIHIIASAKSGYLLSDIIRDFKRHTSKNILNQIIENSRESRQEWMLRLFRYHAKYNKKNQTYQFWRRDNHPIELVSPKWIWQKLNYIHSNPVKAGVVINPEEYMYSSAANYLGKKGILEIDLLNIRKTFGFIKL